MNTFQLPYIQESNSLQNENAKNPETQNYSIKNSNSVKSIKIISSPQTQSNRAMKVFHWPNRLNRFNSNQEIKFPTTKYLNSSASPDLQLIEIDKGINKNSKLINKLNRSFDFTEESKNKNYMNNILNNSYIINNNINNNLDDSTSGLFSTNENLINIYNNNKIPNTKKNSLNGKMTIIELNKPPIIKSTLNDRYQKEVNIYDYINYSPKRQPSPINRTNDILKNITNQYSSKTETKENEIITPPNNLITPNSEIKSNNIIKPENIVGDTNIPLNQNNIVEQSNNLLGQQNIIEQPNISLNLQNQIIRKPNNIIEQKKKFNN